jgi:hypothetical protein
MCFLSGDRAAFVAGGRTYAAIGAGGRAKTAGGLNRFIWRDAASRIMWL